MTMMSVKDSLDEARYRILEVARGCLDRNAPIDELTKQQLDAEIRQGRYRLQWLRPENRCEYSSWEKLRDVTLDPIKAARGKGK